MLSTLAAAPPSLLMLLLALGGCAGVGAGAGGARPAAPAARGPAVAAPSPAPAAEDTGPVIDLHYHVAVHPRLALGKQSLTRIEDLLAHTAGGRIKLGLIVMAPRGDPAFTRWMNDRMLELVARAPGQLIPIASVHPMDGAAALAELERLAGRGVRIVKLHPSSQGFDVAAPEVLALLRRLGELGMVALFDGYSPFDPAQTGKFLKLAIAAPRARLILAHMGGTSFHDMYVFAIAARYPWYPRNVWFDLSAVASFYAGSPYAEQLVWVARQLGPDRILFGSDFPLIGSPAEAVRAIGRLGFTAGEQRLILHDNAAKLLAPAAPR